MEHAPPHLIKAVAHDCFRGLTQARAERGARRARRQNPREHRLGQSGRGPRGRGVGQRHESDAAEGLAEGAAEGANSSGVTAALLNSTAALYGGTESPLFRFLQSQEKNKTKQHPVTDPVAPSKQERKAAAREARQAEEANRQKMWSKRTGGGFAREAGGKGALGAHRRR